MDNELLKKRLRYQGAQYAAGSMARGGREGPHMLTQAADIIENLEKETERLKRENFSLAAEQCIVDRGLLGDEHGHQYCALQKEIERLRNEAVRHGDIFNLSQEQWAQVLK